MLILNMYEITQGVNNPEEKNYISETALPI